MALTILFTNLNPQVILIISSPPCFLCCSLYDPDSNSAYQCSLCRANRVGTRSFELMATVNAILNAYFDSIYLVSFASLQHITLSVLTSFAVAGATLFIYDYLLTVNLEIELVWRSRWTATKCLYFIQRYLPFVGSVFLVLCEYCPYACV